jgi:hypothetical protein
MQPTSVAAPSKAVFLNRRAATRYRALASIIPGPRLIEKRIYRAAVRQRLRTTGLRHEMSSLARTLGSWVRIPLEARMSVCVRAHPTSKESYRLS